MKAMVYTAPGKMEFQDVADPTAAHGEVLINVEAVGICGSELEGFASASPMRVPPLIMGHEFTGHRSDTGDAIVVNPLVACRACDLCLRGMVNLCRRRKIIGIHRAGGYAERVAVPEENLYSRPPGVTAFQAAMTEPFANAVHAVKLLHEVDPLPRQVAVIGGGTLGLATAIVAMQRGADVTLTDMSSSRRALAREAGIAAVESELKGEFDAVFDAVGLAETRHAALSHIRPGGTSVWIGLHEADAGFDGLDLIRMEKRVLGTFCYHDQDFRAALDLVSRIDESWIRSQPLAEGVEAFLGLLRETPREVKTVLTI